MGVKDTFPYCEFSIIDAPDSIVNFKGFVLRITCVKEGLVYSYNLVGIKFVIQMKGNCSSADWVFW